MRPTLLTLTFALAALPACAPAAAPPVPGSSTAPPAGSASPAPSTSASASPSTPAPSTSASAAPSTPAPALAADGKHFAAEVKFQGPCQPAGGRGGCYAFTFKPDGGASQLLLDARQAGTYHLEGNTVVYRATSPDATDQRLISTDGFRTLPGDYRFTP